MSLNNAFMNYNATIFSIKELVYGLKVTLPNVTLVLKH